MSSVSLCALVAGASRTDRHSDGTGDARPPEAAVPIRIFREVLLVVVLGVVELGRGQDLGRDRAVARGGELNLEPVARQLRRAPLSLVEIVDARAVLRADVVALPHALRR